MVVGVIFMGVLSFAGTGCFLAKNRAFSLKLASCTKLEFFLYMF